MSSRLWRWNWISEPDSRSKQAWCKRPFLGTAKSRRSFRLPSVLASVGRERLKRRWTTPSSVPGLVAMVYGYALANVLCDKIHGCEQ